MIENQNYFPKKEDLVVPDFPPMILLNLTNVCPLSCTTCPLPQLRKSPGFVPERMNLSVFKKIIDEVARYPGTVVKLLGDGEPLAVPWIPEMVEYAKSNRIEPIGIITSGFILTENQSRRFLKVGMDYIDFSLDALTEETYNKVRIGSDYKKVMANLETFLRVRQEIQGETPKTKVLVNIIDQPETHNEVEPFITHWNSRVDGAYARTLHSVAGLVTLNIQDRKVPPTKRWPCRVLWERLDVDPDGSVSHCSISWERREAVVGNVMKENLKEIWVNAKNRTLRESHISGHIPENRLCYECNDWQAFKWGDSSQKYLKDLVKK